MGRWSEMSQHRIPEIHTLGVSINILSIRLMVVSVIRVGLDITGIRKKELSIVRKSRLSSLSKSKLKSPHR